MRRPGTVLGPPWGRLGPSLSFLWPSWACPGASWGRFCGVSDGILRNDERVRKPGAWTPNRFFCNTYGVQPLGSNLWDRCPPKGRTCPRAWGATDGGANWEIWRPTRLQPTGCNLWGRESGNLTAHKGSTPNKDVRAPHSKPCLAKHAHGGATYGEAVT